jgi:hypothetical protein
MKTLIVLLSALTLSISVFASEKVDASQDNSLQVLDLILGIKQTYSQTSGLEAKVIELLGGDGVNATRMTLVLNTHYTEKAKIYELGIMMSKVTRITFLAKDVIVINYEQTSFEGEDLEKEVQLKKSLKVTVQRDTKNQLTDSIITEDISKTN